MGYVVQYPKTGRISTDFFTDVLTPTIETELVRYTNAFRYNATDKTYYREFDPKEPQYVGTPSPEIDDAWNELLRGEFTFKHVRV